MIIRGSRDYTPANPLPVQEVRRALSEYILQDVDETTTTSVTYLGKENTDGTWLIVKIDESSDTSFRYANESNNESYITYATAWAAITSLTYATLENLTGL